MGVTSNLQPGFFVAEHQSITDLVSSQPGFAKKGVSFRSSSALIVKGRIFGFVHIRYVCASCFYFY